MENISISTMFKRSVASKNLEEVHFHLENNFDQFTRYDFIKAYGEAVRNKDEEMISLLTRYPETLDFFNGDDFINFTSLIGLKQANFKKLNYELIEDTFLIKKIATAAKVNGIDKNINYYMSLLAIESLLSKNTPMFIFATKDLDYKKISNILINASVGDNEKNYEKVLSTFFKSKNEDFINNFKDYYLENLREVAALGVVKKSNQMNLLIKTNTEKPKKIKI